MATAPKVVTCFSHIPMIRFPDGFGNLEICGGTLGPLPSEHWAHLDRTAAAHLDGFKKTAPVFFWAKFREPEEVDLDTTFHWAWGEFDRDLYILYLLLLLTTITRLPEPDLSKQYYYDPQIGSTTPRDAVFGYEAVAYAYTADPLMLEPSLLKSLQGALTELQESGWIFSLPEVRYVRDILFTVSRPEFTYADDAVYCTSALEALLVPEPMKGVAKVFSRRGGALLTQHFEGRKAVERLFHALYDFRSRLVHGEDARAPAETLAVLLPTVSPLTTPRFLLCNILWKLIRLPTRTGVAIDSIPAFARRLDEAYESRPAFEALGLGTS
jgi:hypothetical protein